MGRTHQADLSRKKKKRIGINLALVLSYKNVPPTTTEVILIDNDHEVFYKAKDGFLFCFIVE